MRRKGGGALRLRRCTACIKGGAEALTGEAEWPERTTGEGAWPKAGGAEQDGWGDGNNDGHDENGVGNAADRLSSL